LSNPLVEAEPDPYPLMVRWRQTERLHMIEAIRELIEDARKMAKSQRAPAREKMRWTRLAGQLIWYKDSILKNMELEMMGMEILVLKQKIYGDDPESAPKSYTPPKIILPRNPSITPPKPAQSTPDSPRQGENQP